MKKKTINSVINKKFDDFLISIKDDKVKALIENNSIITGGCIASMLLREDINDFDLYFTNKETVKAVAEYYVAIFNESNHENGYVLDGAVVNERNENQDGGAALNMSPDRIKIIFDSKGVAAEDGLISTPEDAEDFQEKPTEIIDNKPKYRPIYLSGNAITLSNKIQIVIRFYGDPETIHQHYDYIHCTNYWLSKDRELHLNQPALEALLSKELKYVGSKYPIASVIRTRKFIKRGWTINAGQYLKMAFQISELNLQDIEVLEDQLVGVDVAYFHTLIDALKSHAEKQKQDEKNFRLEYGYLSTIIDKIF